MKKETLWTIGIILGVILLSYFILNKEKPKTEEQIVKCIGKNSVLYIQLGCSACKKQEEIFGDNYQKLTIVDCFFEKDKCIKNKITATPTWEINGKKIEGVQSISKLQNLTSC